MYKRSKLLDWIYFDIETIPAYNSFGDMPKDLQQIWIEKRHQKGLEKYMIDKKIKNEDVTERFGHDKHYQLNEVYLSQASLYAEFAKILCISFGMFDPSFKSILCTCRGASELETLNDFLQVLHRYNTYNLAGFNILKFDLPFIKKRMLCNLILSNYPPQLPKKDEKPWEAKNEDLMQSYKMGGDDYVSLALLCALFDIPSPKDKFSNSEFPILYMTGKISPEEADEYCEKDVSSVMQLMFKLSSEESNYDKSSASYSKKKSAEKV